MKTLFSWLLPRLLVSALTVILLSRLPAWAAWPASQPSLPRAGMTQPDDQTIRVCGGSGQSFSEDTAPLQETINITGLPTGSKVSNVTVDLNILHSWSGDVVATLTHNSTTVTLINRPGTTNTNFNCNCGCPYDNLVGTFADSAVTNADRCVLGDSGINAANSPYKPLGPGTLAGFNGSDANGSWTLTLQDRADDESGSLPADGVCLNITYLVPTAVDLAAFAAEQRDTRIQVIWQTTNELDNRGFNLYRGNTADTWDRQLNTTLIPAQGQGGSGAEYVWEDQADLVYGQTYSYWLETVDVHGGTILHGPVSATYQLPTAVRLRDLRTAVPVQAASPWLWIGTSFGIAAWGIRRFKQRR